MAQIISPVGVDVTKEFATADSTFKVGTRAYGADGSEWIYAKQCAAVAGDVVAITNAYAAAKATKALADTGDKLAVSQMTKTNTYYGWFLVKGGSGTSYTVRVRASCLPNVALYTSAVAGMLDDTSTSQTQVRGITIRDTASASGAAESAMIAVEIHV